MIRRRRLAGLVGVALACAAAATVGHAGRPARAVAAATGCANPPAVYPIANVTAGLTGTGKTVISGTTPTSFNVSVLGVVNGGIAPGIDLIVVKLSGAAMQTTGGAFEGISGSPVYVGGKLLGSVSYSLSTDRTIAGLTPAQPIVNIFSYPRTNLGAAPVRMPQMAPRVSLTPSVRTAVASASHVAGAAAGNLNVLKTPVGVSGLSDAGLAKLQRIYDKHNLPYTAFRGGSAAAPAGVSGPAIVAGSNFAATQSFGDLTFYGLGTATAVCGDEVMAFGHPFGLTGPAALGMNNADTIGIISVDPFYAYKLANITGFQGIVDQDRLAGIRGIAGVMPQLTGITTNLQNTDLGSSRTGKTDVADQQFMALIALFDLYEENTVTFDRDGSGSEGMSWTISGTYQGTPFTLTRSDLAYSPFEVNFDAGFELAGELGALQSSKFGPAQITDVQFNGTLTQARRTATITKVESRTPLQPTFAVHRILHVLPGGPVNLRVTLTRADGTVVVAPLNLTVPTRFRGGELVVRGGQPPQGCLFCAFGETFSTSATSFEGLLQQFQDGEHTTDLVGSLLTNGRQLKTILPRTNVILGRKFLFAVAG